METTAGKSKWPILIIVLLATFMGTLDGSIVNVALPKMADSLHVATSDIQFVSTSYLIVIAGVVLVFGRLGDMYGKGRMFNLGLVLFTVGSLLCSVTYSFPMLIAARAIQAAGAAGTMANNQGIIAETFPVSERGKALGFLGTAVALGSLIGPGLGGLIVGALSWEYIFLINVPIGVISLILSIKLLPKGHKSKGESLDMPGTALFILAIVPLFTALSEGLNRGFGDPLILAGFALSIVSFTAFVLVEKRRENPLVQFKMFENRLFSLSILCGFISFIAIFCSNIILPFYLQDVMRFTPAEAGLILMVSPLFMMVVAPLSGSLSDKIGSELLTFIGLMAISAGLILMSTLNVHSTIADMVIYIALMSIGSGLFQSPNNSLIMSTVERHQMGIAGSINALVRNMGMVSGIALSTTLLYGVMSLRTGTRVTDYSPANQSAFICGMQAVYITAGIICLVGAILTFARLAGKNRRKQKVEET